MKYFFASIMLLILLVLLVQPVLAYSVWPASSGTDISANILSIYSDFGPSGAVWQPNLGLYIVIGDRGYITEVDSNGVVHGHWSITSTYDLEDVTFINETSSVIYLLDENTSSIIGFDLNTGTLNGEHWSFYGNDEAQGLLYEVGGVYGVEGLAWLPDGEHPFGATDLGGVFAVGWQDDGDIYFYEPKSVNTIEFLGELHTTSGYTDISGFNYDSQTRTLRAIYDGLNLLEEWDLSTAMVSNLTVSNATLNHSYNLFGYAEEAVAFRSSCPNNTAEVLIGDDNGQLYVYQNYPVSCVAVDADSDGFASDVDCNDGNLAIYPGAYEFAYDGVDQDCNGSDLTDVDGDGYSDIYAGGTDCDDYDPSVHDWFTYYFDRDGDGLGSDTTNRVCSITPPVDHVTNSDDTNDLISNAGIEIHGDRTDNDGDGRRDEYNTLAENGLHPYYSTLDPMPYSIGDEILSTNGFFSGEISVSYEDNSVYRYQIFSTASATRPRVLPINNSAYLVIVRGSDAALVNGYTGEIMSTMILKSRMTEQIMVDWLVATLGL
ncbi:MAG: MopE-related protein [Candidatus Uhrbacteria bacterium]